MAPDLAVAASYAIERLERELSPKLCYHTVAHTRDEVAVVTAQLAARLNVRGIDLVLLQTAAYFHDLGFVVRRRGHEEASVAIAAEMLPAFGYELPHIHRIAAMIRATSVPQRPRSLLAQILADADLDVLGRSDFLDRNSALRQELANYGEQHDDHEWYAGQLMFLKAHQYWTPVARAWRDGPKEHNCRHLQALASRCRRS